MRSPVEYFNLYQSLPIPSPDGSADLASGISVDRYRLGAQQRYLDERLRLAKKVQKDLQLRKKKDPEATIHVRVATADGYEEYDFPGLKFVAGDQLWALLRYPFVGKGSPEAVQVALQLAANEMPGSPPFVTPDNFQSYCDKWFGLDCNGFVGNFLRHEPAGIPWQDVTKTKGIGPDAQIDFIWNNFEGTVRSRAADIDHTELNLMVLVDSGGKIIPGGSSGPGHVVISGPGERADIDQLNRTFPIAANQTVPAVCVVESTGAVETSDGKNGLARSFYAYMDHPHLAGVIRVHRGLNGSTMNVRVKGAPWTN
jgi:hypothetical protein